MTTQPIDHGKNDTVWKFGPFYPGFYGSHPMPKGAEILHAAEQHGDIQVWALVDAGAPVKARRFCVVGTGQSLPVGDEWHHIDSVLVNGGFLVWHVFDGGEVP